MLFMPTNIVPDLKSGIGLGVVDADFPMKVSWQVNGDYPVMTGMMIQIYQNNAASTLKYSTGKVSFGTPFYGTDALGNLQYYSYTIPATTLEGAGILNGNEYKMIITQYYNANGTEASVTQNSASVFITRQNPTFNLSAIPATVTASSYTFNLSYSQQQGDTVDWIRYQIAQGSDTENPIYDSGNIYGAAVYTCTYSSFRSGFIYSFKATGQTSSGVLMDTGWKTFLVSYSVTPTSGEVYASAAQDDAQGTVNGVWLSWSELQQIQGQSRWIIFREQYNNGILTKIADLPSNEYNNIVDYGVPSGQGPYNYLLAAANSAGAFLTAPVRSNSISPIFYRWTLLLCSANDDGTYTVKTQYHFRYNMESGSITNNNTPNILQNFTANPTVQPAPQNYRSGTLKALIGKVSAGRYTDSLSVRNALMALSVTESPMFLKSSKGDVMRIRINGAVTAATSEKAESLAQTVSVPWIALEDAEYEGIWGTLEINIH